MDIRLTTRGWVRAGACPPHIPAVCIQCRRPVYRCLGMPGWLYEQDTDRLHAPERCGLAVNHAAPRGTVTITVRT